MLPYGLNWNAVLKRCISPVKKSTIAIVLLLLLTKACRHLNVLRVTGICSVTRPNNLSREFQQIVHQIRQATLSECPGNLYEYIWLV